MPPSTASPADSPAVAALTIPVDGKGNICGDNLVVADLAVLGGAILVCGFHLQNAFIDLPLCHWGLVYALLECWGELIDILYLDVDYCPKTGTENIKEES